MPGSRAGIWNRPFWSSDHPDIAEAHGAGEDTPEAQSEEKTDEPRKQRAAPALAAARTGRRCSLRPKRRGFAPLMPRPRLPLPLLLIPNRPILLCSTGLDDAPASIGQRGLTLGLKAPRAKISLWMLNHVVIMALSRRSPRFRCLAESCRDSRDLGAIMAKANGAGPTSSSTLERLSRLMRAAEFGDGLNPAQWEALRYLGARQPVLQFAGRARPAISAPPRARSRRRSSRSSARGYLGKNERPGEKRSVVAAPDRSRAGMLTKDPWRASPAPATGSAARRAGA